MIKTLLSITWARDDQYEICTKISIKNSIAKDLLDSVRDYLNLLRRIITGEKTWVYG